jgi:regulator of cell morphogenesis and NO signaling
LINKEDIMLLGSFDINDKMLVSDIVAKDYHTADTFRKYGIDYCCGGKWSLEIACKARGLDTDILLEELKQSMRNICLPNTIEFDKWDIDFLIDYVIKVHHENLRKVIPQIIDHLERFANGHRKKFSYLNEMEELVNQLAKQLLSNMCQEEEVLFPYIRQIAHAYENKESYAKLFVRTLRKPVEAVMHQEHETVVKSLRRLRELTDDYIPPENACISHKVTFFKLKEFDNDLVQHLYLENSILFPRAIKMEKELLQKKD